MNAYMRKIIAFRNPVTKARFVVNTEEAAQRIKRDLPSWVRES